MTKPGAINKKKNVYHGNHKSVAKRALKGRAKTLAVTKSMDGTQQRKRLTNPKATVMYSKKKQRLLNKGKKNKNLAEDEDDNNMEGVCCILLACGAVGHTANRCKPIFPRGSFALASPTFP